MEFIHIELVIYLKSVGLLILAFGSYGMMGNGIKLEMEITRVFHMMACLGHHRINWSHPGLTKVSPQTDRADGPERTQHWTSQRKSARGEGSDQPWHKFPWTCLLRPGHPSLRRQGVLLVKWTRSVNAGQDVTGLQGGTSRVSVRTHQATGKHDRPPGRGRTGVRARPPRGDNF